MSMFSRHMLVSVERVTPSKARSRLERTFASKACVDGSRLGGCVRDTRLSLVIH